MNKSIKSKMSKHFALWIMDERDFNGEHDAEVRRLSRIMDAVINAFEVKRSIQDTSFKFTKIKTLDKRERENKIPQWVIQCYSKMGGFKYIVYLPTWYVPKSYLQERDVLFYDLWDAFKKIDMKTKPCIGAGKADEIYMKAPEPEPEPAPEP